MIRVTVKLCLFVLLFVSTFAAPLTCKDGISRENCLDLDSHLDHLDQFPCSKPVPHFIPVEKIEELRPHLAKFIEVNIPLIPHGTVLHRCTNCGYCSSTHDKCQVVEKENVSLQFQTSETRKTFEVTLSNHTRCDCVKVSPDY